ncbi:hypothetical protein Mpsy_0650 [Methanolobus psychrophilus R15]|nr:hypothetical protein Mpsy_0650 [Methanolobus psychrophilus R15]
MIAKITEEMLNDMIRKFRVSSSEYFHTRGGNSWVDIYAYVKSDDADVESEDADVESEDDCESDEDNVKTDDADVKTEDDYVTLCGIDNELFWEKYPTVERYVPKGTDTSDTLLEEDTEMEENIAYNEGIDESDYANSYDYRHAVDAVIKEKYEMVEVYEDNIIGFYADNILLFVYDDVEDFESQIVNYEIKYFLKNLKYFKINDVEYKVWGIEDIDGGFEIYFTIECRE